MPQSNILYSFFMCVTQSTVNNYVTAAVMYLNMMDDNKTLTGALG